jgi:hypothetical protein
VLRKVINWWRGYLFAGVLISDLGVLQTLNKAINMKKCGKTQAN